MMLRDRQERIMFNVLGYLFSRKYLYHRRSMIGLLGELTMMPYTRIRELLYSLQSKKLIIVNDKDFDIVINHPSPRVRKTQEDGGLR